MELYALDENFLLASTAIPFENLQWTRRYYESGEFMMRLPSKIYEESWKYIGIRERPELGMIQKTETSIDGFTTISGFFCEKMLDDKVIFPAYTYDGETAPINGGVEGIVLDMFEKYKSDLPIIAADAHLGLSDGAEISAMDDQLGEKIFSILETFELSYRVKYDYEKRQLIFEVWQGLDRTQSQFANTWQVFSSEFGTLSSYKATFDNSAFKNYAIIPIMDDGETVGADVLYLDWSNGGYKKEIVFDMRSEWPDEYTTDKQFKEQKLQEAAEMLAEYAIVEDIDVEVIDNQGYLTNYDLGDKCDVILSDIGLQMESRIVQIEEVIKSDGHSVTIGLGNKRIDNIRRAVS